MKDNYCVKCGYYEGKSISNLDKYQESNNDLELAEYWASFADVFVLDAFASSHRAHSSTAGISKYLPTYFGLLMESEINNLEPLINNTKHPFIVIMGGAKVDDKIKIIDLWITNKFIKKETYIRALDALQKLFLSLYIIILEDFMIFH